MPSSSVPTASRAELDQPPKLKLSIALSTFNGAAYLPEQLASITAQTRLPDEIVICDDCSTDQTRAISEAFALSTSIPVSLYVNEQNLGSTKTFERAIRMCTGEIVALCDQDDVWRQDKLQLIETAFLKAPDAGLVFSDAQLVDENLKSLGRNMWAERKFGRKQKEMVEHGRALDCLPPGWTVTGATIAFRSKFDHLCLPIPEDIPMIHDGWIALAISAVAEVILLDDQLIKYRQHSGQQIGAREYRAHEKHPVGLKRIEDALQRSNPF